MLANQLLYLASLVTFTFGALIFSMLVLLYWRERSPGDSGGRGSARVLRAFTLVAAASFVMNLALQVAAARDIDARWVSGLSLVLQLTTSLLPPLIFHLVYAMEAGQLPRPRIWRLILVAFYPASFFAGIIGGLDDAGLLIAPGWLSNAPVAALGTGAALGLAAEIFSRWKVARAHHLWLGGILACMLGVSVTQVAVHPGPFFSVLPDYLVLALLCVALYFEERLIFFDVLIKRGAMFSVALAGLTAISVLVIAPLQSFEPAWMRPWTIAVALTPFWLAAPWVSKRLEKFVDRAWLRRRYSTDEAEQRFARDVQAAATEASLAEEAARSLGEIFSSRAEVSFGPLKTDPDKHSMAADLEPDGAAAGRIRVAEREHGAPFMSDDHRLLRSLARTLAVVLQNVRLMERQQQQEERERQLRLLASRAELKALRAQINPHFLFNALNAIAGLIHDDPRLADETVERLAQVFRYALSKSQNEWVRLGEELEFVEAYLSVEQARFGRRLRVELEIDPSVLGIPVPAVSIQPLVENAIKHGVSAVEGAGVVGVRAAVDRERLRVEVFDNGPGFPPGYSIGEGGHGLRNIADRLAGYYGDSARLWWRDEAGGNRVFLELPVPVSIGMHAGNARIDRG